MRKPRTITLCGSTRFQEEFERVQRELTLGGVVAMGVGVYGHGRDRDVFEGKTPIEAAATKRILDAVHLRKIDLADEVLVVNPGGYVGESTWREVVYAAMLCKGVTSLEEIPEGEVLAKMGEAAELAERFAIRQLDSAQHDPCRMAGAAVTFRHRGRVIYDPWIKPERQGEPWAWEMHGHPDFGADPIATYGRRAFARFVYDTTQAVQEYRDVTGADLPLP